MAELTPAERLQPSLLDRLTDDDPQSQKESRDQRVLSVRRLRECVLRDLAWLLNTTDLGSDFDSKRFPQVAKSVLNYGVPDLAGLVASSVDAVKLEGMIRQAIWDFEPRILRNTVKVRVIVGDAEMSHNALTFVIEGELWAQPLPERMYLRTEVDLETGGVTVASDAGGRPSR